MSDTGYIYRDWEEREADFYNRQQDMERRQRFTPPEQWVSGSQMRQAVRELEANFTKQEVAGARLLMQVLGVTL